MAIWLALDVGSETIGLAWADEADGWVTALYTIHRTSRQRDVADIAAEAARLRADGLVVGLAFLTDGAEGDSARRARHLGELVGQATGLPVAYQDEHLSTFEATERLQAQGYTGEALALRVDAEAARVILEDWLRQRGARGESA